MDRDTLYTLYVTEKRAMDEVAALLNCSKPTVAKWLKRHGIPSRSPSEARRIAKKPTYSPEGLEAKRRAAAAMRARITAESIEKHRLLMIGRTPHNKGKPWTEDERRSHMAVRQTAEYRRKLSQANSGERAWNWKGGVKDELARRLDTSEWRRTRVLCYERDNWLCADCGTKCLNTSDAKLHPKRKIQAHHIIPRRQGGSDDLSNLVTLCMSCHHKRERRGL